MNPIRKVHEQAMDLTEEAFAARIYGDTQKFLDLTRKAYELEAQAAHMSINSEEPTRSILHRSAASLAFNAGLLREAEKLVCIGLAGDPPGDIADELRDLFMDVVSARQLALKGA